MNILITLCARGGSKGVPDKNIALINGLPLIGYSIKAATQFKELVENEHKVYIELSTDSKKIRHICNSLGVITTYTRPLHLASDSAGKISVIKDILNFKENLLNTNFDLVLDLDVTSPLRTLDDLQSAFHHFINNREAYNSFSVSNANKNPYFNMVESKDGVYAQKSKNLDTNLYTRQSAPVVYDINASFYFYRRIFFNKEFKTVFTPKTMFHVIKHICFDIDEPLDLEILNYLVTNNKLEFNL
ncbi:MAG: acylneuraminate cytidylyltransferase family protein [Saprospiraceae bacterium]